jgi:hypothetical protein
VQPVPASPSFQLSASPKTSSEPASPTSARCPIACGALHCRPLGAEAAQASGEHFEAFSPDHSRSSAPWPLDLAAQCVAAEVDIGSPVLQPAMPTMAETPPLGDSQPDEHAGLPAEQGTRAAAMPLPVLHRLGAPWPSARHRRAGDAHQLSPLTVRALVFTNACEHCAQKQYTCLQTPVFALFSIKHRHNMHFRCL